MLEILEYTVFPREISGVGVTAPETTEASNRMRIMGTVLVIFIINLVSDITNIT